MFVTMHRFVSSQNVMTALSFAAMKGRADCLRLLIGAGADKNAKSRVSFSISLDAGVGVCVPTWLAFASHSHIKFIHIRTCFSVWYTYINSTSTVIVPDSKSFSFLHLVDLTGDIFLFASPNELWIRIEWSLVCSGFSWHVHESLFIICSPCICQRDSRSLEIRRWLRPFSLVTRNARGSSWKPESTLIPKTMCVVFAHFGAFESRNRLWFGHIFWTGFHFSSRRLLMAPPMPCPVSHSRAVSNFKFRISTTIISVGHFTHEFAERRDRADVGGSQWQLGLRAPAAGRRGGQGHQVQCAFWVAIWL
jgi:hypothetical protein